MPPPSAKNPVVAEEALRPCPDPARAGVRPAAQVKVASCVMFVSELDRSIDFYSDVLACEVSVRDSEAGLLMAHGGFQIYLVAKGRRAAHPVGGIGTQHLTWASDSEEALQHFEEVLRARGAYTDTHTSGGVRVVEGRDPDGLPVIIAHPSPAQRRRTALDPRLYA